MSDAYEPTKEDRFTFGLWTVGNVGRDPFGEPVRQPLDPIRIVARLSDLGAYGVNLHDNDLVPIDATPQDRDRIVSRFKKALEEYGMVVPMASTNLFYDPVFRDGAFTNSDPEVRAFAVQKTMKGLDLAAELGAKTYVFWGGREGSETDAGKDPVEALKWYRQALNFLMDYNLNRGYNLKFALEAKPNEPRGDIYLPTTGAMLAFIETLDKPEMFGVNPEVAHETMAGLSFPHAVAQALEAGKLFHIDLNAQKIGRFDQDFRFGAEDIKGAFFLVKLLDEYGYDGPRHFDAHAYRTADEEDVWAFARGCMRTYKILQEKVRRFNEDDEIQGLLKEIRKRDTGAEAWSWVAGGYGATRVRQLQDRAFDRQAMAQRPPAYERLDQLLMELLLGIR